MASLQDLINSGKPLRCRNCGDRTDGPERDCPNPSPGKPYVDCGRGGHFFDELADPDLRVCFTASAPGHPEAVRETFQLPRGWETWDKKYREEWLQAKLDEWLEALADSLTGVATVREV